MTSETWKSLVASEMAILETCVMFNGIEFPGTSPPVVFRGLMQEGVSVGNVVSATCNFSIDDDSSIPKSAEVKLLMRLTDGEIVSEWQPVGTFYVSRRSRDSITGITTLECYDALLKANTLWEPDEDDWPRTMVLVTQQLAALLGLEIDERTEIATEAPYVIDRPEESITIREALSNIAVANGGNWIVTPEGKLRLVPLIQTGDLVSVDAVLGDFNVGRTSIISGIRNSQAVIGDESGIVVGVSTSEALAEILAVKLIGQEWQAFELSSAEYDPAAELGDSILYGDDLSGVLCVETANIGPAFRGNISSPEPEEVSDEYPYLNRDGNSLRALRAAVEVLEDTAVAQVRAEYAQGESAVNPPETGWSALPPERTEGFFVWQRTVTLYTGGRSDVSQPVNISGADGEPASVLRIDSSRGTVFKNNQVSTTLSAVIFRGPDRITDAQTLRRVYGAGAYLQWSWQRLDEDRFGLIAADDARLGQEGFTLTLSAADVDTKVTFMCELMI